MILKLKNLTLRTVQALAVLAILLVAPRAAVAQYNWVNTANQNGNWNATARWTGGPPATFLNAVDATATFSQPLSNAPSGNYNVQLSNTPGQLITIGGLTVNNYVGANDTANLRIGANGNGTLTFQVSSGQAFYTENVAPGVENTSAGITTIFAPVTFASDTVITQNHALNNNNGTQFSSTANSPGGITAAPSITLTKEGGGNVEFNVAPTAPATGFQGFVVVNGGAVRQTSDVFANAAGVTVNNGGQFQVGSATVTDWNLSPGAVLNLNGTGKASGASSGGALRSQNTTGVANFNAPIVLQTTSSIDVNGVAAKLTLTKDVSGPGGLTKSNDGTLVLAGSTANSYAGLTRVQAGTLALQKPSGVAAVPGNLTVQNPTGTVQAVVRLDADEQIADTSDITLQQSTGTGTPNGQLSLNGFSETIGALNSSGGAGVVQNGAAGNSTLTVNASAATSAFSGVIQDGGGGGTVAVAVSGAQVVSLSGANTYSGGTTVSGKLSADNTTGSATGTGPVTVAGGTLGGSGTITGDVAVVGGNLSPGNSPATLTLGNTTIDGASELNYELDTPGVVGSGVNDLTVVNGNLELGGTLNVLPLSGFGAGVYRLFNYTGGLTLNSLAISGLPGGYSGSLDTSIVGEVNLNVAAVPEPSTLLLAALSFLALTYWYRRHPSPRRV